MTLALALTLLGLGGLGAFVAGLLGIGGAIVTIPLLLYVPPLLGVGQLDVKSVAGVTMTQVCVAAVSGFLAHRRHGAMHTQLAMVGGIAIAAGSLAGSLLSKLLDESWLLVVFASLATLGAVLMFVPHRVEEPGPLAAAALRFSALRIVLVTAGVGLAAGFVGAGGAFLLVPLLLVFVGVPVRITIGSSLGITALSAAAGFLGKLITHQVPLGPALAVSAGALAGAQLGAAVSRRMSTAHLRHLLSGVIVLAALRVWWDVFGPVSLVAIPLGFALGLLIGVTGMGGGVLIGPLVYSLLGVGYAAAVALALTYTLLARIFGALNFRAWASIRWRLVLLYGLAGVPGAALGAHWLHTAGAGARAWFPLVLAAALVVVAALILLDTLAVGVLRRRTRALPERMAPITVVTVALVQLVVGALVGITAVGSGSLVILSMLYFFRMTNEEIVGTNLIVALMMMIPAGVTHVALGTIDWRFVGLLMAGSMAGTVLSPAANALASGRTVRLLIAALVVAGAIGTFLRMA
ncbi:MAG: sulfite exporter TauE/SafE family protein [Candidatus Rokubacteria bacterium]|nr:sulfite exporter TauE/SafE family protein [Candidatus Rokubacteria bacterium]